MKKHNLVLLLVALMGMMAGCTTIPPTPEDPLSVAPPETFSHAVLNQVLRQVVDENGRVDYTALAGNTRDLERYYRLLATYSPDSHPRMFPTTRDRLAYWINAYNAATIKTVLNYYPITSVVDVRPPIVFFFMPGKSGFFLFQRQILGGREISLYGLENGIVRRRFIDPRYHFALNCASNSCPRLPAEAFEAQNLEMQLERETRKFLSDEGNFKIDHPNQRIYLSAIFDWYEKDFIRWTETRCPGRKGSLPAYIRPYLAEDKQAQLNAVAGSYAIHFFPYDWGLNDAKQGESGSQK